MRFESPIYPGTGILIAASFRNPETSALMDPVEPVSIVVRRPDSAEVELEAEKTGTGIYQAEYVCQLPGVHHVRGISSGPLPGVDEGSFTVRPTNLP